MASVLQLVAGELRLELAPLVGGSIAAFYSLRDRRGGDNPGGAPDHHPDPRSTARPAPQRIDWLRPAAPVDLGRRNPLQMASFPLLPWCNRIRDGRAAFAGRTIALAPNHPASDSPHPLHGIGWLRPWAVQQSTATSAQLGLQVEADARWPWRFEASQRFELQADRLDCLLTLTNRDSAPMPAGIGHHPYFPHRPGTRLRTGTRAIWRSDAELLPTSLDADSSEVAKLRAGVRLAELDLDNNFTGWSHRARVDWPQSGCGVELSAQPPLDFFVLYCPPGADHFCAEPVSQCTDAINLAHRWPVADLGGTVLAPGETLAGQWRLTPFFP